MIFNLWKEHNLRGYAFEYIAKVVLRRQQKNNFIFPTVLFDNIDEISKKYRFNYTDNLCTFIDLLRREWKRCDLIEFKCQDKKNRLVYKINVYEVKTKIHSVKRDYFEICLSNHKFYQECNRLNVPTHIVSIIIFENWRFSFNIIPYEKVKKRIYTHYKKDR